MRRTAARRRDGAADRSACAQAAAPSSEPAGSAKQPQRRNVAITIGALGRTAAEVAQLRSAAQHSSCARACHRSGGPAGGTEMHDATHSAHKSAAGSVATVGPALGCRTGSCRRHSTLGATAAGDGEFELRTKWSHGAYVDADSFDVRLRPQALVVGLACLWWHVGRCLLAVDDLVVVRLAGRIGSRSTATCAPCAQTRVCYPCSGNSTAGARSS
jgi:hypothetical protein